MANRRRTGAVNWTVLASFSFLGVACGSTETQGPSTEGSTSSSSSASVTSTTSTGSTSSGTTSTATGTSSSTATSTGASGTTSTAATSSGASGTSGASGASSSTGTSSGASGSSTSSASTGSSGASSSTSGEVTSSDTTSGAPTGSTDDYNPEFKEFVGEDCEVAEAMDVNNSKLPSPFLTADGAAITKKSEWACQRAYIKKAVEKYIHGTKPGTPDMVTGSVTNTGISVHVEHGGKTVEFSVSVSLPSGADGPVPIIIGLGGVAGKGPGPGTIDFGATIKAEGVATGNYNHNNLSSETNRSGLFQDIYGSTNASAQIGWAWGISRVMDVLVSEKAAGRNEIIDPTRVGITGCSRNGKGAFTVGAFDERIALGLPQESGTGGVSALRIVNTAVVGPNGQPSESISSARSAGPAWFGPDFDSKYASKVNTMPVDMHSLVAMYAPRGLLVLDNSRIGELGSTAQHAATVAGGAVHKALGVEKNAAYHGGNPDDPHDHCSFYQSQVEPLQRAIRGHLTRTAEPDGRIEPQPVGTADLEEWIDWETPTLE